MKNNIKYHRITEFKEGCITGPFSPLEAAKILARHLEANLLALYRIDFTIGEEYNIRMYQELEKGEGYTGYDHLIAVFPGWVVFFVDRGTGCHNIAACFGNGDIDISVKDSHKHPYKQTLNTEELTAMIKEAFTITQEYVNGEFKTQFKAWREKTKAPAIT